MTISLNATHDPARRSWVASANVPDADFPIQNLPFGVFDDGKGGRGGVALGDEIIDLAALLAAGAISGDAAEAASGDSLLPLFAQPREAVSALRAALSELYREGGDDKSEAAERALVPMADARLLMPAKPTAFTDFCTSADHILRMAANGGREPNPAASSAQSSPTIRRGRHCRSPITAAPVQSR